MNPHTRSAPLLLGCCLLGAAVPAAAQCVDQSYTTTRANGLELTSSQSPVVQTFTVGRTGPLLGVDLDLRHWRGVSTFNVDVAIVTTSNGVPTTTVLAMQSLPPNAIPTTAYATVPVRFTTPVPVQMGQVLGLSVSSNSVPSQQTYAWSGDAPGQYAAGTTYVRGNTGPLSFDMGFATLVGTTAAQANYGAGHAGTSGVPSLLASANPVLGTTINLLLGNAAGQTSAAVLLLGQQRASLPTPFGGSLLLQPLVTVPLPLPQAGATLPVAVPADPFLCGVQNQLQLLHLDSGASFGVAFSAGLELTFGF